MIIEGLLKISWSLLSGWLTHITRVFPKLDYNVEMILCAIIALSLSTWIFHRFLNWLHKQGTLKNPWPIKQTLTLTSLLLMLFGMSVAMTGIVHQAIWVSKGKVLKNSRSSASSRALIQAKNIVASCYSYAADHKGIMPANLNTLLSDESGLEPNDLLYPLPSKPNQLEPWVYYQRASDNPSHLILLHSSSSSFSNKWIVAKLDASVRFVEDEEFQKMLAKSRQFKETFPTQKQKPDSEKTLSPAL